MNSKSNNIIIKNDDNDSLNNIINNKDDSDDKDTSKINIRINEIKRTQIINKLKEEDNFDDKKNYSEVEDLQYKVNKSMERLKIARQKVCEFEKEINTYIKDEIANEFFVYLNKTK